MQVTMPAVFLLGRWPLFATFVLGLDRLGALNLMPEALRHTALGLAMNFLLPVVIVATLELLAWIRGARLPLPPRFTALSCAASAAYVVALHVSPAVASVHAAVSGLPSQAADLLTLVSVPLAGLYLEARQVTRTPSPCEAQAC